MSKLLRANLARLWKNKVFWFGFFALIIFCVLQKIGMSQDMMEVHYLEEAFWIQAFVIGIILSVFISLFVGAEYEYGTIRNKVISGHSVQIFILPMYLFVLLQGGLYVWGV